MIVDFYKERHYSLAEIRRVAQSKYSFNEAPCTGLNHLEILWALEKFGLGHYKVGFGADAGDVWRYLAYGPVFIGVWYGSYPNEHGRCGSPKAEISGRTDCNFRGPHAILAIGKRYHTVNGSTHKDIFIRDPDHNSPARPEKPKYDRITASQLNVAMRNLPRYSNFSNTYIIYPTRRKSL
jgi:hypothetical protein